MFLQKLSQLGFRRQYSLHTSHHLAQLHAASPNNQVYVLNFRHNKVYSKLTCPFYHFYCLDKTIKLKRPCLLCTYIKPYIFTVSIKTGFTVRSNFAISVAKSCLNTKTVAYHQVSASYRTTVSCLYAGLLLTVYGLYLVAHISLDNSTLSILASLSLRLNLILLSKTGCALSL